MTFYLLKYISETGRPEILRPTEFITIAGVKLGFGTNIVTTDGANPIGDYVSDLTDTVCAVSGDLLARILSVSGASSLRDDTQDLTFAAYAAARAAQRTSDLAAQDARDDAQDVQIQGVSSASDDRDDLQDLRLIAVSGNLQNQINEIVSDRPEEERFEAVSGQQLFTLSMIELDVEYDIVDAWIRKNGIVMCQSTVSGTVSGVDWEKTAIPNQVRFLYPLKDGDKVVVRRERTGGGGSGGGGFDVENLIASPAPAVQAGVALGTSAKPFSGIFLYDAVSGGTWLLQVVSGSIQIDEV